MSKLEIRGVIVSADWDDGWMEDWIQKGVMTPESRVRTQLAEAKTDEPLTVYINSVGGSVFSGNEIVNSLNAWTKQTGQKIEMVVGSLAASMAANLLVAVPGTVKAHSNAKIMFHGPWGSMTGGSGAMADTSDLLKKMGADMKAALLGRTSLSAERIEEGFSEGRELWLSAEEAKSVGLVSEIVDSVADSVEFPKAAADALSEHGVKLAAMSQFVEQDIAEPEPASDPATPPEDPAPEPATAPEPVSDPPASEPEPAAEPAADPEPEPDPAPADPAPADKVEPAIEPQADPEPKSFDDEKVKEIVAEKIQLGTALEIANKTIETLRSEARDWQSKHDQKQTELDQLKAKVVADAESVKAEHEKVVADLTAEHTNILTERDSKIDGLESQLSKLTLNALAFSPDSIATWPEALSSCDGDYATARKKYPSLYNQFMEEKRNKGK